MIVRIMGEGQREVTGQDLSALNALDGQLEGAIEAGDEVKFREALHGLLAQVRSIGTELPPDRLEQSELILPPADASMDEVRAMLSDEGLIPD